MVKLKAQMVKTDSLEEFELAKKYGQIVQTPSGRFRLLFPTQLNDELETFWARTLKLTLKERARTCKYFLMIKMTLPTKLFCT